MKRHVFDCEDSRVAGTTLRNRLCHFLLLGAFHGGTEHRFDSRRFNGLSCVRNVVQTFGKASGAIRTILDEN